MHENLMENWFLVEGQGINKMECDKLYMPNTEKNVYHLDTEVLIHALCAIHVGFILTYKHNSFNFDYYTCTILNHYQFNNIFDTKEFNFWSYL